MDFTEHLDKSYQELRHNLRTSARDYKWRISQLRALKNMLVENDDLINSALWSDLRKPKFECVTTEQGIVLSEIEHALKNLKKWIKPQPVPTPLYNQPGRCEVVRDSLGLTLIIGAWNYPVQLLLAPLVGAIAGGNGVILKPSEIATHTAALMSELVAKYLDPSLIRVIEAGPEETSALLSKQFDLIFFTGSGTVGKIVMTKAAENLTPVVLELGGKSPAIVMADADIEVAAKRITWGKFMNAGQTCVAPDYVLVHPGVKAALVAGIKKSLLEFYGPDPQQSPDYCRIINAKNFDRLAGLIPGSKLLHGGKIDRDQLYIEPTLVASTASDTIMQNEIFGPLLPVVEIQGLTEAIEYVNDHAKPLSLYLFTSDEGTQKQVLSQTSSGGVCINDVIMQMPVESFPFGGVGASGMGHYHGQYSFDTFTHAKGVLRKATWVDVPVRYAPYTLTKMKWIRRLF